jgi:hypothetical protein
MTRGPLPVKAIGLAIKNAAGRGIVIRSGDLRLSRADFLLFSLYLTVFVRIRRERTHLMTPEDCAAAYRQDILLLRRVPLTAATAREIWLLSPWGTWQYFRVLNDRVIEIRADGTPVLQKATPPAGGPVAGKATVPGVLPAAPHTEAGVGR